MGPTETKDTSKDIGRSAGFLWYRFFVNLVVLCGLGWMALGLYNICCERQVEYENKLRSLQKLKECNRRLEKENSLLQEKISYLQTEAGVEEIAREKLGLIKPGEVAYVVAFSPGDCAGLPSSSSGGSGSDEVGPDSPVKLEFSWIQSMLHLLFAPRNR